jgi:hypothetical protein
MRQTTTRWTTGGEASPGRPVCVFSSPLPRPERMTTTTRCCACGCGASFGRHESLRQTLDEVGFEASASGRASAGDVDGLIRALEREAKRDGVGGVGGVGKGGVGHTVLHYAARGGSEACVEACLRYGYGDDGVLDARTKGGATALHKACDGGHARCARALLRMGASVEARDNGDETPLHKACARADAECVRVVYEAAPDVVHVLDARGRTPLDAAPESAREMLKEILRVK